MDSMKNSLNVSSLSDTSDSSDSSDSGEDNGSMEESDVAEYVSVL